MLRRDKPPLEQAMTNPPLQVGRELPDVEAIQARIDYLDEERDLLRKLLRVTIRIEGRKPLAQPKPVTSAEASHATR
jgi:hypothetical protein